MIEMKTAELTGPALDWAVAKALNGGKLVGMPGLEWGTSIIEQVTCGAFHPSTDWGQGGRIIDEYGIEFKWVTDATLEAYSYIMSENTAMGGTHLVAACRLLAMELGDMVQVPAELVA